MSFLILVWLEGGLITTDLTSGHRLILVHTDERIANACGSAVVKSTGGGQPVATVALDCGKDELPNELAEMMNAPELLTDYYFVFPEDPLYLEMINQWLAPGAE
jgi:hypothetical protein